MNLSLTIGKKYYDRVTDSTGVLTRVTQYSQNYVEGTIEGRSPNGPWSLTCSTARLTEADVQSEAAKAPAPAAPAPAAPAPAAPAPAAPAPAAPAPAAPAPLTAERRAELHRQHVVQPGALLMQQYASKASRIGAVLQQFGVAKVDEIAAKLTTEAEVLAEYARFMAACKEVLEAA